MKKKAFSIWMSIALVALLPLLTGVTWGKAPLDSLDLSDKGYRLPVNLDIVEDCAVEEAYTETTYEDSTIRVSIETKRIDDRCDYWIADVTIADPSQLRTASASKTFLHSRERDGVLLCQMHHAVVGLNGDFPFGAEKLGYGYFIRQGDLYKDSLDTPGRWDSRIMDILLIDEDGDFQIIHLAQVGAISGMRYNGKRILNSFCFGPALVMDGKAVEDFERADWWIDMSSESERQRVALCQVGPLHYKVICCSGPYKNAAGQKNTGMTLAEFAKLLETENVQVAYNLDGGYSALLYFHNDRVNTRPDSSIRELQDIIYFVSAEGL